VTPVIIGTTGTISKSFRKYLSSVPGQHGIKELQKTAVLGTAHTLGEVLMYKHKEFNIADSAICTVNSTCRVAAALCTLETWFVSGIQVCIPCVKGVVMMLIIKANAVRN
jgi:hypothetical protein